MWLLYLAGLPASRPAASDVFTQQFIVVALVYPVLEEVVFRGLLQGWLLRQDWGKGKRLGISNANLVTSIVFVAVHVARRPGLLSAGVLLPSLVFGYFRERYDNLYAPIAVHIFYNACFVLYFA